MNEQEIMQKLDVLSTRVESLEKIYVEVHETNRTVRDVLLGSEQTKQPGLLQQFQDMTEGFRSMRTQITFYAGALSILAIISPILIGFILYQIVS